MVGTRLYRDALEPPAAQALKSRLSCWMRNSRIQQDLRKCRAGADHFLTKTHS